MSVSAQIARHPRVGFKHPVRVIPMSRGGSKAYRLLSANLSRDGMFLAMPGATPLEPGTRLTLSLEAGGRVLPFAEAEVMWRRLQTSHARTKVGFGVRFTGFLHPRASALVTHLLDEARRHEAHVTSRRRWLWGSALASALATAVALVCWTALPMASLGASNALASPVLSALSAEALPGAAAQPAALAPVPGGLPPPSGLEETAEIIDDGTLDFDLDLPVRAALVRGLRVGLQERVVIPSGAAASLVIERTPDTMRVTVEPLAEGKVRRVFALDGPARLVFDVDGRSPQAGHFVALRGPELRRVRVGQLGRGTRVVVDLARRPRRTAVDGDAIVLSY